MPGTCAAEKEGLRPEIATSWWRSKLLGVKPDLAIESAVAAELTDADEQLRRSLKPVLDDLVGKLAGTRSAVLLADHRAVIIDRRATSPAIEAGLDRFAAMPGYSFSEACVGTNGVGTAAEERRQVRIAGAEHYAEIFKSFACHGVPLVHPLTRRLIGVLDLAFPAEDEHPLMPWFAAEAGLRIEALLVEWSSVRQRAQFDHFLAVGRRSARPVLSVMDDTVLLNRSACRLDPAHQAELLRAAQEIPESDAHRELTITLSGEDTPVSIRVHTGSEQVRFPGVVFEIVPGRRRSGRKPGAASLPGLVGASPAWTTFCSKASAVAATGVPVLLEGEAGVGKAAVARALHQLSGKSQLTVVDVASAPGDGERAWLKVLRRALQDFHGSVVIRHLELCDRLLAAAIAGEIDRAPAGGSRLFATLTLGPASAGLRPLIDRFGARLEVPSLDERRPDIPIIVPELLARHTTDSSVRFHPLALAALARAEFAGNIRELESVVVQVLARRRKGDVLPSDLTAVVADEGPAQLSPRERAERAVIIDALHAANSNKAAAAASLGISRPTLYRKIRIYRIPAG
jgi:sigma-54 dependent transcriptional regulator, acetoin dehydrogenase operon transcriptional activator AcoR